jgi:hypothetical protein
MDIERPIDFVEESFTPIDEEFNTSVVLKQDTDESIQEAFMATGQDLNPTQAKEMLFQSSNPIEALLRDRIYTEEMQAQELEQAYKRIKTKAEDFSNNADFIYEQAKSLSDDSVSPLDIKIAVNMKSEEEVLKEWADKEEAGFIDATLDFLSTAVREETVGILEPLQERKESLSTEMLFKRMDPNTTPNEYKAWFRQTVSEIMQEGLRENNALTLEWIKDAVYSNGYDSDKNIDKAFSLIGLFGWGELAVAGTKGARSLKLAKAASQRSTRIGRIAELEGAEAAGQIGEGILARRVDAEVATDLGPRVINPHAPRTPTSEGWYSRAFRENILAEDVRTIWKSGAMGRIVDEATIATTVARTVDKFRKSVDNPVYASFPEDTGFGNYLVRIQLGKPSNGTPFKPTETGAAPEGVERLAERTGGEVVEVRNKAGDLQGYVVEHRKNIDLTPEIEAIDPMELVRMERGLVRNTLGQVFGNKLMGSTALRGVDRLTTLAQMGEASQSAVKGVFQREAKKINALNPTERANLASIVGKLRDDSLEAKERIWYNLEQFNHRYKKLTGKLPSQRVIAAYDAEVAISDTAAIVRANNIMRSFVQKGYSAVEVSDGIRVPARKVSLNDVPQDALILDINDNVRLLKSELEDGLDVWLLHADDQGVSYVTRPKKVDALDPQDVMGYNAGGPRTNPDANFFVVLGREGRFPKALLTTFTQKDADTAVRQIQEIQKAIQEGADNIDEIISKNNDWDMNIDSLSKFREFADENDWNITDGFIAPKERNSYVQTEDASDVTYQMSFSDFVEKELSRQDKVLKEFGGKASYNLDPMDTITQQFGTAIQELSQHAYTQNAIVGWVKKAQQKGVDWLPKNISPNDYRNLFMRAEVTGNTKFDRSMREIQSIEKRRMGVKSEAAEYMEDLGRQLSEFVFDKSATVSEFALGKGNRIAPKLKVGDPTNTLLNIGFQTSFGFFNASQLIMQASHAATIMAISPKHGMRGAAMALGIRSFYHTGPEALEVGLKRASKVYGIELEEMREIVEYVRTSGRDIIDAEAVEQGTGVAWGISGFNGESYKPSVLKKALLSTKKTAKQGLDKGLFFFNQGERLGRLTGTYTAILEFKAKNPGVSILSDRARMWISRRDQDLTFNMTATGRPLIQSGLMRVPTQWLSYSFRAMESIFVGRNFTAAERRRMFYVLMPMYGAAGFGLESAADSIAEYYGIDVDTNLFTGLKWGAIDGIGDLLLEDTSGRVGLSLGKRLAPAGAIVDTYRNIMQGQFTEVVGGPAGSFISGYGEAFMRAYASFRDNRGTMLTDDVINILRQPSGLDAFAKGMGIVNHKIYRNKSGTTVPGEFGATEAVLAFLGISNLKAAEYYDARNKLFTSSKKANDFRKEVNKKAEYAFELLKGDEASKQKAFQLFKELKIYVDIGASSFSPEVRLSLLKSINRKLDDDFLSVYNGLLRQDKDYAAERLRTTIVGR